MGGIFYKNYSVSRKCLGIEGVSPEYKLDRRIGDLETLAHKFGAWAQERNAVEATRRRKFNKNCAREKLHRYNQICRFYVTEH
jgi:hypothetical protein